MAYIDSQEVFSVAQAVTAIGDTVSTNQLDTLAAHDQGIGQNVTVIVKVHTTFTSAGAPTVQAVLQTSADNSTWVDAAIGPAFALAALTAGTTIYSQELPNGVLRRYIRVAYRVATAVYTAGAFDAFIVKDPQAYQFGPSGFVVL